MRKRLFPTFIIREASEVWEVARKLPGRQEVPRKSCLNCYRTRSIAVLGLGSQKLWLLYGKSFTMSTKEFNIQFKCVPNREAVVETAKYHNIYNTQDLRFQHHPT